MLSPGSRLPSVGCLVDFEFTRLRSFIFENGFIREKLGCAVCGSSGRPLTVERRAPRRANRLPMTTVVALRSPSLSMQHGLSKHTNELSTHTKPTLRAAVGHKVDVERAISGAAQLR